MPTFAKIRRNAMEYGFMLKINNDAEMLEYVNTSMSNRFQRGFVDCFQSKELGKLVGAEGGGHCTTEIGHSLARLCELEKEGRNLLQITMSLHDRALQAQVGLLHSVGTIYINRNGGFFGHDEDVEVLETREMETFVFPSDDVRITQWPNGTHWYARIGDVDVRDCIGEMKWNTHKEAERAVEWFRKNKLKVHGV